MMNVMNKELEPSVFKSEEDITRLLRGDPWRMDVLRAAAELDLPDWWIGAGFLRNAIWDSIEGKDSPPTRDVDLVYFDGEKTDREIDLTYDNEMKKKYPIAEWEIRNQARMHYVNDFPPYTSTEDGISHWVETATCVAVKTEQEKLRYLFCHGTDDLFGLVARPIPKFRTEELMPVFYRRIEEKNWRKKWPHLRVELS
jgi:hypothetical protein